MRQRDPKVVKSAVRVMQILEYFDRDRRQLRVMDIARGINCPQSSASELLKCLCQIGYLNHDRTRRTYEPSARLPLLGAWVQKGLFGHGTLLSALDELSRAISVNVILSIVVDSAVMHVHIVTQPNGPKFSIQQGTTGGLLHSSLGHLFLSGYREDYARDLVRRLNAYENRAERRLSWPSLAETLKKIRQNGYAAEFGEFQRDVGMISMLLQYRGGQTIAATVHGPPNVLRNNISLYVSLMRKIANPRLPRSTEVGFVFPAIVPPAIAPEPSRSSSQWPRQIYAV